MIDEIRGERPFGRRLVRHGLNDDHRTVAPYPSASDRALLLEQIDYYCARAEEYDEWWSRSGRYDRGAEATVCWRDEVQELEDWLRALAPTGQVLELACGTGWWTERLARTAVKLKCIDASSNSIELNKLRLAKAELPSACYRIADLFAWDPEAAAFDVVFFSFWLSHVPEDMFESFWLKVRKALKPSGKVILWTRRLKRLQRLEIRDFRRPEFKQDVWMTVAFSAWLRSFTTRSTWPIACADWAGTRTLELPPATLSSAKPDPSPFLTDGVKYLALERLNSQAPRRVPAWWREWVESRHL